MSRQNRVTRLDNSRRDVWGDTQTSTTSKRMTPGNPEDPCIPCTASVSHPTPRPAAPHLTCSGHPSVPLLGIHFANNMAQLAYLPTPKQISTVEFSYANINQTIRSLKSSKGFGTDGMLSYF
ncbi:unnamed protein product [Trichobilharzia regenti]|nr:unnamed protein product [Trichobilharzia regenti]